MPARPWFALRSTIAALVLASQATNASNAADPARHAWTVPGTLRIGLVVAPNNLNPLYGTSTGEAFVDSLVLDPLVYALPDGTIEPVLAARVPTIENGGISRDGRTITYRLRRGVRWQDGKPFTSADVAFTQAAAMNPANNIVVRQPYDRVTRLDTPNPFTVVVHLRAPYAPFVTGWIAAGILPAHLLAGKHDLNNDPFSAAPLGTGAFRLDRWQRGSTIELSANRDYFDGTPGLQRIVVSLIPDYNAAVLAMRTHQIDWIYNATATAAQQLTSDPDVRVERMDQNQQEGVFLNVTRPLLRDVRVRRALSLGVARTALASKLGLGFITPATADIPSFMWAFDATLRAPYDPSRARALLERAGWHDGPDGIRVRDGTRLSLLYLFTSGNALEAAYAVQLAAEWHAIGVDVQLKSMPANVLYAIDGPGFTGTFDLAFTPFTWAPDPDDTQLFSCATVAPRGNNWSRWCDADFERWTAVALTHEDRATRRAAYARIERRILDDVPEIVTGWQVDAEPVSVDLRGFRDRDTYARPYRWSI
jgi:peptide/nickel transport system substrate-binding protein